MIVLHDHFNTVATFEQGEISVKKMLENSPKRKSLTFSLAYAILNDGI